MLTVISLMLQYLFGLGCLFFILFRSTIGDVRTFDDSSRLQMLANILVFGIKVNHLIVLLLADLNQSLFVGCVFSVIGLSCFVFLVIKEKSLRISYGWLTICGALYIACLFIVLVEPLYGWDARSIWFFHAKMIFYNASINAGGDWSLPSLGFSHPDYPLLIPILAAQIAFVAGYWNEYLPKMSLVALLIPAMLCLISILRDKWWYIFFISVPLLFTQEWLSNGYMDGYLALYAGIGTFFWGRWLDKKNGNDLISGILFTGVVLDLKNEGMLYSLIIACLILIYVLTKRNKFTNTINGRYLEYILIFLFSIAGLFLWEGKKHLFGLKNDLHLGINSLDKISERLTDGSLYIILRHLYVTDNINLSLGIFLLSLVGIIRMGISPTNASIFCFLVGIAYFSGIVLIYLATPYDLIGFHLPTGNRTMLPVHIIFLAATLSLFCKNEDRE